MRILVSNDDGYFAPGLAILAEAMRDFGQVVVVAPETNRSGASNALTLDRPLSVKRAASGHYYVNGNPTDCVHIALTGMHQAPFDLIVSGINAGQNMGDDTLYSGTVAAAMEGFLFGLPAIAFSLDNPPIKQPETARRIVAEVVQRFLARPSPEPALWNVNIPACAYEEVAGVRFTRLGKRHVCEPVSVSHSPRGEKIYWIGAAGAARDAGAGTDFDALASGYVSITPLRVDLTDTDALAVLTGAGAQ